jgi:hypothetical protein
MWVVYRERLPIGGVDLRNLDEALKLRTETRDPAMELLTKVVGSIRHGERSPR